jgi:ATP-dependent Lon protease
MTGEITLRGRVLPVGGIRDKVLAAQRAGIRTVILPRQNERDLGEVPAPIREHMHFELVERFEEVLPRVFAGKAPGRRSAVARSRPTAQPRPRKKPRARTR